MQSMRPFMPMPPMPALINSALLCAHTMCYTARNCAMQYPYIINLYSISRLSSAESLISRLIILMGAVNTLHLYSFNLHNNEIISSHIYLLICEFLRLLITKDERVCVGRISIERRKFICARGLYFPPPSSANNYSFLLYLCVLVAVVIKRVQFIYIAPLTNRNFLLLYTSLDWLCV
jgi:hypothetical protein